MYVFHAVMSLGKSKAVLFFLVACATVHACIATPAFPVGDVRNCPYKQLMDPSKPLLRIDVLPGMGFDNLRNLEIGQVYQYNYSTCQISEDGIYLLPDSVFLVPVQHTELDLYAHYIDHFDNHTSETSNSVNVEAEYGRISGKFSADFQNSKMHMVNNNASSTRATVRHHLYKVILQPDAQLHPRFKARILELVAYIQNNESQLAHYLTDLLVLNYGTHIITHVDAGASLSQTTMLSKTTIVDKHMSRSSITASASASFFVSVKASYSHTSSDENVDSFNNATTHKHITTHGGPPFQIGNFSVQDWEAGVPDHLVAIDRSGQLLWTALTTSNVPELDGSTLQVIIDHIYMAVDRYYKVNTHHGCTDPDSENFNYFANVDDKSCKHESINMNFTFGGVYQTCTAEYSSYSLCQDLQQTNPLTQGYSCPPQYKAIPLHTGTRSTKVLWFYLKSTYNAYWCAQDPSDGNVPRDSGYMFGGLYTPTQHNPVTQASNCPPHFFPLRFLDEAHICVSNDERGLPYQLPFGGLYSCNHGNGLAAATAIQFEKQEYPKVCPIHYDQLLATVDENCQINYCTSMKDILDYGPVPPKLPPYIKKPVKLSNATDILMVVRGANGRTWVKDGDGNWAEHKNTTATDYYQMFVDELCFEESSMDYATTMNPTVSATYTMAIAASPSSTPLPADPNSYAGGISTSSIVGIVLGSILGSVIISSIITFVAFGINFRMKKRSGYGSLELNTQQRGV